MLKGMMLAASGALGGGTPPVGGGLLWSQTDKNVFIALSAGDKTATKTGDSRAGAGSVSSSIKTAGKWYAEFFVDSGLGSFLIAGFSPPLANRGVDLGQSSNCFGYSANGAGYYDSSYNGGRNDAFSTGDVISLALDIDGNSFEFSKNGVSQGVENGYLLDSVSGYVVAMSANDDGDSISLIQPADYNYPIPAGYSAWTG